MSIEQYIESTKYLQWEDGMYVMLDDMECDYELALVEDSLRCSVYFYRRNRFIANSWDNVLGVYKNKAGIWCDEGFKTKLTRAQALYIATGETTCTTS
jgi:hypothetical protein